MPKTDPCSIRFSTHPAGLRADVRGEGTFENTLGYWTQILAEVLEKKPPGLLLIDETTGGPLFTFQWQALVEAMRGKGFEQVRIAHVRPRGLQQIEHCEIFAREAGIEARVFTDETQADLWLRHGGD